MRRFGNAILISTIAMTLPAVVKAQDVGLPLGTVGQPVVVENLDGEDVNLDAYLGKQPVLMQFWATWCEQCKALEPTMAAAHEAYGDRVKFLGVAVGVNQSPRSIRRHLERSPVAYDIVWDGRGRAVREYRAPTTSYVVLFDAAGAVVYTGVGSEQDIGAALERVTSAGTR